MVELEKKKQTKYFYTVSTLVLIVTIGTKIVVAILSSAICKASGCYFLKTF